MNTRPTNAQPRIVAPAGATPAQVSEADIMSSFLTSADEPKQTAIPKPEAAASPDTSDPKLPREGSKGGAAQAASPDSTQAADDSDSDDATASGAGDDEGMEDDFFSEAGSANEQPSDDDEQAGDDKNVYTVTVDGRAEQVTLADLLKTYSGEKAIERRLEAATATRTQAEQELRQVQSEKAALETERRADKAKLATAIKALEGALLEPKVGLPPASLKQTDPTKYLIQMEAYRADQERLRERKAVIEQALAAGEASTTVSEDYKREEATKLVAAIPALRDANKAPKVKELVFAGASAAGFSPAEINVAVDHRLFVMALKAGLYDKMQAGKKREGVSPAPKAIAPGAATARPTTARTQSQKALVARAAQTRADEDILPTLIVPRARRS